MMNKDLRFLLIVFIVELIGVSLSIWVSPLGNELGAWIAFLFIYVFGYVSMVLIGRAIIKTHDQTGEG